MLNRLCPLEQYDIPVLHLGKPQDFDSLAGRSRIKGSLTGGRVMKHRIDKDKLVELVNKWTLELNEDKVREVDK